MSLQALEFLRISPGASAAPTLWRGGKHHRVGGNDLAPMFEAVNNEVSGVKALVPGAGMFTSGAFRASDRATGAVRELTIDGIVSGLALYGTSRAVPRNQPCPCGSGRKFKRCCLPSRLGSHHLGGGA